MNGREMPISVAQKGFTEKRGEKEKDEKFWPTLFLTNTSAFNTPPETPCPIHLIPSPEPPPEPPAPQPPMDSQGVVGSTGTRNAIKKANNIKLINKNFCFICPQGSSNR